MKNKKKYAVLAVKILLMILTFIFPITMVCLAGAGLVYNGENYGKSLVDTGIFLIISGILMTSGSILCILKKRLPNILSLIFSISGFSLCMIFLYRLCEHADSAGWADSFSMQPVSDMYKARILPIIFPVIISVVIAIIHISSREPENC